MRVGILASALALPVVLDNKGARGDSGGPWFYGTKALGLYSGFAPGDSDWFSGIGSLNLLGVVVITT
ncbi:hypothetical protein CCO02nite_08870 [Cellulomonas composti]|uniref:Peptidase S1 domain-containing protein n=1 Tax=Cellulomonas composti TaxID=266130 RepID=A0A511J917_9CELL|nr:hypothetical protein CCO02nite_08870 [Cellulomonas composti]